MSIFDSLMSSLGYVAKADDTLTTAGMVTSQIATTIAPLVDSSHKASVLAIANAVANDISAVHAAAAPMAALGKIMASQPNATATSVLNAVTPILSVVPSIAPWLSLLHLIASLAPVVEAVTEPIKVEGGVDNIPHPPSTYSGGDSN